MSEKWPTMAAPSGGRVRALSGGGDGGDPRTGIPGRPGPPGTSGRRGLRASRAIPGWPIIGGHGRSASPFAVGRAGSGGGGGVARCRRLVGGCRSSWWCRLAGWLGGRGDGGEPRRRWSLVGTAMLLVPGARATQCQRPGCPRCMGRPAWSCWSVAVPGVPELLSGVVVVGRGVGGVGGRCRRPPWSTASNHRGWSSPPPVRGAGTPQRDPANSRIPGGGAAHRGCTCRGVLASLLQLDPIQRGGPVRVAGRWLGVRWQSVRACGMRPRVGAAGQRGEGHRRRGVVGAIGAGLCVLVGVTHDDDEADGDEAGRQALAPAGARRRRRRDEPLGRRRRPASCSSSASSRSTATRRGGRRPSWIAAARPEHAEPLVDAVVAELRALGATVATGRFRTEMRVALVNDGPVTARARAVTPRRRRRRSRRGSPAPSTVAASRPARRAAQHDEHGAGRRRAHVPGAAGAQRDAWRDDRVLADRRAVDARRRRG